MAQKPHIVFFGHHKCGSRFFRKRLLARAVAMNGYTTVSYEIANPPFHFDAIDALDLHHVDFDCLLGEEPVCLHLSNSSAAVVDQVTSRTGNFRGVHVVRDPRQIWVSDYFHHLDGHTIDSPLGWVWDKLARERPRLEQMPRPRGLIRELNNITKEIIEDQIAAWRPMDNTIELKLEDFENATSVADPGIQELFDFLGLDNRPRQLKLDRFSNPNAQSWQSVLTPDLKERFKARYGELLIALGYEQDLDW